MRDFHAPGRSSVHATTAMAATSHPLASAAALEVLQAGGNAVDAAVAASAVLAVVEPQMTGIGGDCFAIVARPDGSIHGINGSGPAPKAATPARLAELGVKSIDAQGPHSVTVPGAIRAWHDLLAAHGRRSFAELLKRAISYARDGYPVAPRVAHDWALAVPKLAADPGARDSYLFGGAAPKAGDVVRQPALARTLQKIAAEGPSGFYEGEVARDIVDTLAARGGLMSLDDLAGMTTLPMPPVIRSYRGIDVAELPPNGQGFIALVMLGLLERFDLASLDPLGTTRFHLELEAGRLAYSVRDLFLADPDHMRHGPDAFLSSDYLDKLAARISPTTRISEIPPALLGPSSDTIYLTVVDREGMAVSFINSVYKSFGSGICAPKSGVMLQNRGACFRLEPGHPNCIDGGKRPLHTIIPAMALKDGRPYLSFGVMGGGYQPCGHAHVLSNIVDFGMDPQEAIDAPRMFFDETTHVLQAERHVPHETLVGLRDLGHQVEIVAEPIGGGQAILIDRARGVLVGGSDPRKDGCAIGY
ncbi:gamma-glutamyltransferase [Stappia sp. P2PMeth1]|uniref:gamma-glutamyltransferase n=1 Tax=Stappia sp. P2PMeth1 TaxID=2003586 RepID=UPI001644D580|nr:gamma-glutamyltransferase [Stappia sp. P2PMeth1]